MGPKKRNVITLIDQETGNIGHEQRISNQQHSTTGRGISMEVARTDPSKGTILVVDDTPHNLRLLSTMLIERGYKVRAVINGPMALKSVHLELPDIILLDINMPEMNGYEVCRLLKKDAVTAGIPVLFISALNEAMDKVQAFAVGGVDYITKPFQIEEVLARIEHQLTIRGLQQQLEQRVAALEALNTRLQSELALARNIQQGFLPPTQPGWNGLDVVCYSTPAHEVGGDLYAYHAYEILKPPLAVTRYVVAVGDVSGKGMPAALLMSASIASFRSLVGKDLSPSAFLMQMDNAIADYTRATRQNCAFVYLDISQPSHQSERKGAWSSMVRLSNAGCIAPMMKQADGRLVWIDVSGMPLGIGMGATTGYREVSLSMEPGDMMILTSDGVVEARNACGQIFGFDRLEQAVVSGPQRSARAMLSHLRAAVEAFTEGTEPHDDMTMVVIQT
ncbi:MAG: SpoIIE family protein phosphatase [Chloroflexaceae bacterium]|nr:SpoIIE family protein phosphatase [Chloroflexaceae bacterium]